MTGYESKKAAAQDKLAQQEPVACKHEWFRTGAMEPRECRCIKCGAWNTTPPQRTWVGLTDEDRLRLWLKTESEDVDRYAFAKAIETKLKELNT